MRNSNGIQDSFEKLKTSSQQKNEEQIEPNFMNENRLVVKLRFNQEELVSWKEVTILVQQKQVDFQANWCSC